VVEELQRIGAEVHLAEPAEASALKGKKKRAKTDWADARHLRERLLIGRLPESWIPPAHILDLRARVRARHLLSHQRTEWQQRMQAVLYHHGFPQQRNLLTLERREWLATLKLGAAARQQLTIALEMIDAIDIQLVPFDRDLRAYGRRQTGCRALIEQLYGVGELTAVTILAELGDARRFANSRDAVRYGGLDITVYESDAHRAPGHLSRQGPPALRWALYEAAQVARHPASPDRHYYLQLAERIGGNRACLALARKLLKRCYHILKARRRSPRTSRRLSFTSTPIRHAASPRSHDEPRPAPENPLPTRQRGPPRKTERPHHHLPEHPITHHVSGPEPTRAACRSKPRRPRTQLTTTRPRTPIPTVTAGVRAGGRHPHAHNPRPAEARTTSTHTSA
jgi:transposase